MSVCGGPGTRALCRALAASAALLLVAVLATPADAAIRKRATAKPAAALGAVKKPNPEKDGFVDMPKGGVLQIAISIGSQRLSLYRDGVRVAQAPVSTGTPSHPTPTGVFSIIEKDRFHRSNLYGNAPMFFMQRVTWSGVAMHEGVLPGFAASHGCIRLPRDFAARLWPTTKLGVRVVIARSELAPVNFQHPALFVPTPKPTEPKVAAIGPADEASPDRPVRLADATTTANDAAAGAADRAPDALAAKPAPVATDDSKPADTAASLAEVKPADDVTAVPATTAEVKPADDVTAVPAAAAGVKPVEDVTAVPATTAEVKPVEDVTAVPAQTAETAPADDPVKETGTVETVRPGMPAPVPSDELRKAVEAPQTVEPPTPAQAVPASPAPTPAEAAPASNDPVKPAPSLTDPPKPTAPRTRAADQPAKRSGQVAVFVSRKEKKIFVRQGFIPIFDMPITIENPDQPLGTHVFTAMGFTDNGAGMRWNLITIPQGHVEQKPAKPRLGDSKKKSKETPKPVVETKAPSTAAEALNRIQLPKEAVERISELLIPGSSLVVSDEGLGRETGRYTEFIVLTR